jgi:hypothetical protein
MAPPESERSVAIVRYADNFIGGLESIVDARRMFTDLKEHLAKFGLSLHKDKARLIEPGRLAALRRPQRGERHPATSTLLGFAHYCGWTRGGRFIVKRKTQSKRLTRKLKALRQEAWRCMHKPLAEQHRWTSGGVCIVVWAGLKRWLSARRRGHA